LDLSKPYPSTGLLAKSRVRNGHHQSNERAAETNTAYGVPGREGNRGRYLAAEEEDAGEAGGGDTAPDDDRRREQRPVAVDHLRLSFTLPTLGLASLRRVQCRCGCPPRWSWNAGSWMEKKGKQRRRAGKPRKERGLNV